VAEPRDILTYMTAWNQSLRWGRASPPAPSPQRAEVPERHRGDEGVERERRPERQAMGTQPSPLLLQTHLHL